WVLGGFLDPALRGRHICLRFAAISDESVASPGTHGGKSYLYRAPHPLWLGRAERGNAMNGTCGTLPSIGNHAPSVVLTAPSSRWPVVRGIIERRMLMNFRCAPEVLARLLPSPFRPKLVHGWGMVGICLIRLAKIHPTFWP